MIELLVIGGMLINQSLPPINIKPELNRTGNCVEQSLNLKYTTSEFKYSDTNDSDLQCNIDTINEFSSLDEGWDGYDAAPISQSAIREALQLIKVISRQPEVFPTPNGYVQFEFSKDNGDYLELKITDNDVVVYVLKGSYDELYHLSFDQIDDIKRQVMTFYGS